MDNSLMGMDTESTAASSGHAGADLLRGFTALFACAGCLLVVWATQSATAPIEPDSGALQLLTELGAGVRDDIARVVEPAMRRTERIAHDPDLAAAFQSGDPNRLTEFANHAVTHTLLIDALALFDAQGRIVAINNRYASGEPIAPERVAKILNLDFGKRDIIQRCVRNESNETVLEFQTTCDITPAFFNSSGLSVAYSVPVCDPNSGEQIGVASSRLRFERLTQSIDRRTVAGKEGTVFFITDQGAYYSEDINTGKAQPPIDPKILRPIVAPLLEGHAERIITQQVSDQRSFYAGVFPLTDFKTLDGGGIHALLLADDDVLTGRTLAAREARTASIGIVALLCFLLAALTHHLARQRRLTRGLSVAREEAQAANQAKSDFLANMSHELRTPLTAILGFADILRADFDSAKYPPAHREALDAVIRNGKHLLGLINDILDLSKIDAGKMTVEWIPCAPVQLAVEVASLIRVRADEKGLCFESELIGSIPQTIHTDPVRLRQILINLIGNAIKFTERGGVRLLIRFVHQPPADPQIQFDVLDSGIGIAPDQLPELFKPFTQADVSTTRHYGETGLGLTISKRLAEMLGGELNLVDSKPGCGTRFRLSIPTGPLEGVAMIDGPIPSVYVAKQEERFALKELGPKLDGRILLAEDGPDNQRLISLILQKAGAEIVIAENGRVAVDRALQAVEVGRPFSAVLMDMQMPVMDGYQAARTLRRRGYSGPIIALTAHAMTGDRQKCLDAGCDDYAAKPVNRTQLLETLHAVMAAPHADPERVPTDNQPRKPEDTRSLELSKP